MGGTSRCGYPNRRTERIQIRCKISGSPIKSSNGRSEKGVPQFPANVEVEPIQESKIPLLNSPRPTIIYQIRLHHHNHFFGKSAGHPLVLCILHQQPKRIADKLPSNPSTSKFRTVFTRSLERWIIHNTIFFHPTLFPGQVSICRFVKRNISDSPFQFDNTLLSCHCNKILSSRQNTVFLNHHTILTRHPFRKSIFLPKQPVKDSISLA